MKQNGYSVELDIICLWYWTLVGGTVVSASLQSDGVGSRPTPPIIGSDL